MEKNKSDFSESKVFVMTESELNRRYNDFVVEVPKPKTIEEAIEAAFNSLSEDSFLEIKQEDSYYVTISDTQDDNSTLLNTKLEDLALLIEDKDKVEVDNFEDIETFESEESKDNTDEIIVDTLIEGASNDNKEDLTKIFKIRDTSRIEKTSDNNYTLVLEPAEVLKIEEAEVDSNNKVEEEKNKLILEEILPDQEDEFLKELESNNNKEPLVEEKQGKIYSLLKRFDPFNKTSHRVGAVVLSTLMLSTVVSCASPKASEKLDFSGAEFTAPKEINKDVEDNDIENTNIENNDILESNDGDEETTVEEAVKHDDNIYYNNYSFNQLLEVTTNPVQKKFMQNIGEALDWYNGPFADAFVEEDKDIRTALTWDEMVALQVAYNDYSKFDLHAIFNGSEVDSNQLTNAYKNATLQLICAYILEDEDSLVDVSQFIHDEESIAFVQKYQNLLEAVKNSTGEERTRNEQAFVNELEKDFPITDEVRVEGISHADIDITESKKLAVAPIVQAFELIERSGISLDNKQFNYFDTLGLCNLAEAKFDKIETITLACCEEDKTNPTYEQFKNAKIKELIAEGIYVKSDAERDLSKLDKFKDRVNSDLTMGPEGFYEEYVWYEEYTYKVVKKWKVTTTKKRNKVEKIVTDDRDKAVKEAGEEKIKKAEDGVNKETEEENKKLKEEGEKEAKENQDEMQQKEDEKKEQLEEEVKQDEEDLKEDIEDSNDKINENIKDEDTTNDTVVNEEDFGDHNVNFDENNGDENGNLNDSVKDITTDNTDSKEYNDLPDPNDTEKAFDDAYEEEEVVYESSSHEESTPAPKEESAPAPKEESAPAPKEEAAPKQESAPAPKEEAAPAPASNEKAVNDYVEKQASEPQQDEEEKVLVKD